MSRGSGSDRTPSTTRCWAGNAERHEPPSVSANAVKRSHWRSRRHPVPENAGRVIMKACKINTTFAAETHQWGQR